MALKFYNTFSGKIEIFNPLRSKRVGLYACGPTVYDYAHIGNLRTYIFEDILRRILEYNAYRVRHIMNITDVEDKIIREANKNGKTIFEFVKPFEAAFHGDLKKLNILKAHKYPKATAHIKEMIILIKSLLKKGFAYQADNSIYFDVSKFKKYGRLSGVKSRELKTGTRINADEYAKEEAEDFVLWKAAKPGEPNWEAPFGKGRPGWHIECSAMSMKYLGPTFDIHAGAVDLIFPHHENEIAQSESATEKPFVKYFIEGEHLLVDGKKMAKSLGNFYALRNLENRSFSPLAFRYLVLTAHYRSKLNFTWESLGAAQNALNNLKTLIAGLFHRRAKKHDDKKTIRRFKKNFLSYINNDLETPRALALLWEIVKSEKLNEKTKLTLVADFDKIFGLNLLKANLEMTKIPRRVFDLVERREKYRKEKNFSKADELRKKIESLGWIVEDTANEPKLIRK